MLVSAVQQWKSIMIMKVRVLVAQSCLTLCDSMDCNPPGSSVHGTGKNAGVGCRSHLQGISPTQGSKLGLLHCKRILYRLSHQGSPRILEWVASPFCRGSSWPRNQIRVSCIAGGFFTNWAIREAPVKNIMTTNCCNVIYNPSSSIMKFYFQFFLL